MQKHQFDLIKEIRKFFEIQAFESIIPWSEKNINFSNDISAQRNFLDFSLYPYQIDILKQWEDLNHRKEVVICSPEQMRKNESIRSWFIMENDICTLSKHDSVPFR